MPSTYLSLNVHIVFSTKNRSPFLNDEIIDRVQDYVGGTLRGYGAVPIRVGGIDDHLHLLAGLKSTHSIADLVRDVKKASTSWIRDELRVKAFSWQDGYAAFSVSPERVSGVERYVANQAEHHRTKSYLDELVELLVHARIDYDPKYLE